MRFRTGLAGLLAASTAAITAAGSAPTADASPVAPDQRVCFEVAGDPGDVAIVNLTPVLAQGPGNGLLISSDITTPPIASNTNYAPGTIDPNVAFAPIGTDGHICYINSNHTHVDLIADHLGTITNETFTPANPNATPKRTIDTRIGLGGTTAAPGARICFEVAGNPGDVAIVNLTPVLAQGPGNGLLISSDITTPPVASNTNYAPGTIDPNVAFAPIGTDGHICYINSNHTHVDLIADHLGTITNETFTPANPNATPKRTIDTRIGLGGTTAAPGARICFEVAGNPGDVAIVNLTPVLAQGPGNGLLISSDITTPPVASNTNYAPGTIDPNVAFAPIGTDGQICYINSNHTQVDLIADHLGTITNETFTPANPDATPKRTIDTRDWRPDVYLNFHGSEQLLGATDAQWQYVRANLDGFWGHWSSAPDHETQLQNTIDLTRKVVGRKLVAEHPIARSNGSCIPMMEDYFYGGVPGVANTGVEGRAPDIRYERIAAALYAGDNPDCWESVGGIPAASDKYLGQGYGELYALYQATNLIDVGDPDVAFPLITPGSPGDLAYRNAEAVVIECHMDDCLHPAVRDGFFRVIEETHARGASFVWFTGYYKESGIGSSGWLAKIQQTYTALAERGLWHPGDAVTLINYYGDYPALPERRLDGTPADTLTGILAWLLDQRLSAR